MTVLPQILNGELGRPTVMFLVEWILSGKRVKIVIYNKARVIGGTNYDPMIYKLVVSVSLFECLIITHEPQTLIELSKIIFLSPRPPPTKKRGMKQVF